MTDLSELVIPEWKSKIGKVVCEDQVLSSVLPKSSRDAGFFFNESRSHVIGAKLRILGKTADSVNQEMENGDIKVAASKNQSFKELDAVLEKNKKEETWICVQGIPDGCGKYIFKGYYKYVKRDGLKYLITPVHKPDVSDLVVTSSDEESVVVKKRPRNNTHVVESTETTPVVSKRPFYNGIRYDSNTETRYAVFMNYFQIPFVTQAETGVLNSHQNYSQYVIDFEVYPHDESKKFFLEVKPFRPSQFQEELCEKVAYVKKVPVYIIYGDFDVPFSVGENFPSGYSTVRFFLKDGVMTREEGYVFTERNGEVCMDRRFSTTDHGFYTHKLKQAYEFVKNHKFSY